MTITYDRLERLVRAVQIARLRTETANRNRMIRDEREEQLTADLQEIETLLRNTQFTLTRGAEPAAAPIART